MSYTPVMSASSAAPAAFSPASEALLARASRVIAGGVVSLNRKADPVIAFARAQGARLWDVDGREYLDYHAAFAPHILGHNDERINAAVRAAMERGWSLMGSGPATWEEALASRVIACVPWIERLQITNTGSEATAHAIRLARAFTGREHIILTMGGYNGWHNDVARMTAPPAAEAGPRVSPGEYRYIPASAGIPEGARSRVHIVNFNDLDSVEYCLRRYPTACVLTEPCLQNVGVIAPRPGYLAGLKELCARHGALLAYDEVKTGFRAALGGYAQVSGITPDLAVYGKAIANGYPLGVVGGRADVLDRFAASDQSLRVLIAGTYNAHPFTAAAACATLDVLAADGAAIYARLEALGSRLQRGLESAFAEAGRCARISRCGSAFCVYFMDHLPVDYHDLIAHHDHAFDSRYRRALIGRGVYHFPLPTKQGSVSAAHTEADIDRTIALTRQALQEL
jgi:glutamate-1-semialdehyde 2,1-aminomutase